MIETTETKENMSLEEVLEKYGSIVWHCKGQSMKPLIRESVDHVFLEKPKGEIKPFDVVIYTRGTSDSKEYVLHRVIKNEGDSFIILGDNCVAYEHVPADRIIGVMTGLVREGQPYDFKSAGHRAYMSLWVRPHGMRRALILARIKARRACAKAIKGVRRFG